MRLSLSEFVAFCNFLIRALSHFHFPPRLASLESGWRYEGLYQHKREEILCFRKKGHKSISYMGLVNYSEHFDTRILHMTLSGCDGPYIHQRSDVCE